MWWRVFIAVLRYRACPATDKHEPGRQVRSASGGVRRARRLLSVESGRGWGCWVRNRVRAAATCRSRTSSGGPVRPAWARISEAGAVKMRRLGKRIGVSARRRVGVCSNHQLCRDLLIIVAVSKNSLTSPDADTPTRFPSRRPILNATTSPLYARRYTNPQESGAIMNRCLSSEALGARVSPRSDEA